MYHLLILSGTLYSLQLECWIKAAIWPQLLTALWSLLGGTLQIAYQKVRGSSHCWALGLK